MRLLGLKPDKPVAMNFKDYDRSAWYAEELETAVALGLLKGDAKSNTIRPNAPITRAEMAVILARALAYVSEDPTANQPSIAFADEKAIPQWAKAEVQQAVKAGLVAGYPDRTFRPSGLATRAEVAVMVKRFFDKY